MAAPLVFTHRGDPNQMIAASVWATTGSLKDLKQLRALNVAAQIMQTRLYDRFRESEGGTYTPGVNNGQSEVFPHFGVLIAYSQIKAERLGDFEKATREIALALAKDGPTADELARAQQRRSSAATSAAASSTIIGRRCCRAISTTRVT